MPAGARRRFNRKTILLLLLLVAVLTGLAWDGSPLGSLALREAVAIKFRGVRQVSPSELVAWMRDPNRPPPLLIDARPAEQVAVSRIEGAVALDPASPDLTPLSHVSRETPLVVYDGPGAASAAMVTALKGEGFTRVSNLHGGLFRWANEGYPLVSEQGPADKVFATGWAWRRLLKGRYRQ